MGICHGLQVINIAAGGNLYQDLSAQIQNTYIHEQNAPKWYPTHKIEIKSGTKLEKIIGGNKLRVNSYHHQAVKEVASGFEINALSGDGVIEGIEHESLEFALGVQWHPELMHRKDSSSKNLFVAFIDAAKKGRRTASSQ